MKVSELTRLAKKRGCRESNDMVQSMTFGLTPKQVARLQSRATKARKYAREQPTVY